jgi:hypothetical protein
MNTSLWATFAAPFLVIAIYIILSNSELPSVNYTYLITSIGATATLYLGLVKYWVDSDAIFKSLFKDFNERFDLLNEDLNKIAEGKDLTGKYSVNQVLQNYLNLCAEEYYWVTKGRISKTVWTSWSAGIRYYLKVPVIKQYFEEQQPYDDSYYGFLKTFKVLKQNANT